MISTLFALMLPAIASTPSPNFEVDPMFGRRPTPEQTESNPGDYDFRGIVALSGCSGSIVRFEGDTNDDRKAIMLTNGHCAGMGSSNYRGHPMQAMGEILVNRPYENHEIQVVRILKKNAKTVTRVLSKKLLYSTMTNTDMAIYEIDITYKKLKSEYGIDALPISKDYVEDNTPIKIVSGYWRRGYTCKVDSTVPRTIEGAWVWKNSIKYTQPGCETIGGTSGSPIIAEIDGKRKVVGVNNTSTNNGTKCTVMNPCEFSKDANIEVDRDGSYGQQVADLYSCVDKDFNLDLSIKGCKLPKQI